VAAARAAADELAGFGAAFDSPLLRATAGSAAGAVLLVERNSRGACETPAAGRRCVAGTRRPL